MNNFIIGISGVARSGKDTFAKLLEQELYGKFCVYGLKVYRRALAYQLKLLANEQCLEKYGISSFTEIKEEKDIIRPFLVEFGGRERKTSEGTFWTNRLQREIDELPFKSIVIITDVRYAMYKYDEVEWIKEQNGLLVHISRYDGGINNKILPPNDDEAFNDPVLEALADFKVVWPTTDNENIRKLFAKEFIRRYYGRITSIK